MNWDLFIIFGSITSIVLYHFYRSHKERMESIRTGRIPFIVDIPRVGGKPLMFGMLFVAIGAAFFLTAMLHWFESDLFAIGLFWVFGGIALLVYWKVTSADRERSVRWFEEHRIAKKDSATELSA